MKERAIEDLIVEEEKQRLSPGESRTFDVDKIPATKFSMSDALFLCISNARFQSGGVLLTLSGIVLTIGFLSYLLVSSFVLSQIGLEGVEDYFWWVLLASLIICFVGINYSTYMMATRRAFELGTFRALGGRWEHVLKMLFLDSMLVGLLGGIIGAIIGLVSGFYVLADEHSLEVVFEHLTDSEGQYFLVQLLSISLFVSTFFTTTSTIYPFLTITLRSPADTIRSDL